jgi:para-nitrobenzyl esterase
MTALAVIVGLGGASAVLAQAPTASSNYDGGHARVLANTVVEAKAGAKLVVTSPAFKNGGDIPWENTGFRSNTFPGLSWTKGPAGAQTYVVVMQGVELPEGAPSTGSEDEKLGTSIHFLMYNLPATMTKLDAGITAAPAGVNQGSTVHGFKDIYAGPHTHSTTRHDYHLQVFAVDKAIAVDPKMTLAALEKAMHGHVLASGELVGWCGLDPQSPEAKEIAKNGPLK